MKASDISRAAYIAAHAINSADLHDSRLATPGGRQTYKIDRIAEIIQDVFAAQLTQTNTAELERELAHAG